MPKFSANLNFLYGKLPFFDQFPAAAKDGFKAVEIRSPYEYEPEKVRKALDDNGLVAALLNSPSGDWDGGERGLTSLAHRWDEFKESVETMVRYAPALGCKRINVMAGLNVDNEPWEVMAPRLIERLRYCADAFAGPGIMVVLEHINPYDMPGFTVRTPPQALEIVKGVDRPNIKIQYDIYHAQRQTGELVRFMRDNIASIGNVQVADNPGRCQPGTGEINYGFVLAELDKLGYDDWVGLEYVPVPDTPGSLGWIKEMGYSL